LVVPDRLNGADLTPVTIPLSYLLVPHFHAVFEGHIWPILVPGWTLQFELFFYFLFGCSLIFAAPMARLGALSATIFLLVAAGAVAEFRDPRLLTATDPLLLEFLAGVWIGVAFQRLQSADPAFGGVCVAAGFLLSLLSWLWGAPEAFRVLFYGIPAVLVLVGACILEPVARKHYSPFFGFLGDASYSIYLFHGLVLAVCAGTWSRLGLGGGALSVSVFIPLSIAAAIAASCLAYRLLERPLLTLFKNPIALLRRPSAGASRC
jgi:exopolysaccharide production protein ExoZ